MIVRVLPKLLCYPSKNLSKEKAESFFSQFNHLILVLDHELNSMVTGIWLFLWLAASKIRTVISTKNFLGVQEKRKKSKKTGRMAFVNFIDHLIDQLLRPVKKGSIFSISKSNETEELTKAGIGYWRIRLRWLVLCR